jgi:hypothetical protein
MQLTGQSINEVKNATMVNTQAIAKMETQIGHIANHLGEREKGKLPSQPVPNPRLQEQKSGSTKEKDVEPSTATIETPPRPFIPKAPYPDILLESKKGGKFEDILEVFKQVQINIPFLDAIQQVPSYAKFLKDLIKVKRKTNVPKRVCLTE